MRKIRHEVDVPKSSLRLIFKEIKEKGKILEIAQIARTPFTLRRSEDFTSEDQRIRGGQTYVTIT